MSELTYPLHFETQNLSLILISENQPTRTVALFSCRFSGSILISSGGSILVSGHIGLHFWARSYCVSTVGLDEAMVREYIRTQEEHEKKEEQIQLDF